MFKWGGIIAAILITAFIALIGFGIASGEIQARSLYDEWQYGRLTKKLAGKTDAASIYNTKVLTACDNFFGHQHPDDAHYCYQSTIKDSPQPWRLLYPINENEHQGMSDIPKWIITWSANYVFANNKIFLAEMTIGCQADHFLAGWNLVSEHPPKTQTLKVQLGEDDMYSVEYENAEFPREIVMDRETSESFITDALDQKDMLKIWIPDENGVDHEFRFDITKLNKHLSELEKACEVGE